MMKYFLKDIMLTIGEAVEAVLKKKKEFSVKEMYYLI